MRSYFLMGFLFLSTPMVLAETAPPNAPQNPPTAIGAAPVPSNLEDTPEERAYKGKMIELSQKIAQKITEVQKKQKEIDDEIFPAFVPPLQSEKKDLLHQLNDLEMEKTQLEAQKTAKDLQKQLNNPPTKNPKPPG